MIKAEWTKADALDLQPTCNQLATDCISRQAALKLILSGRVGDDSPVECPEECNSMLEWAADEVAKMTTAEKRGRWMETDAAPHRVYCSECYATFIPNREWVAWKERIVPRKYCPNCGAKMDEVDDDT